MATNDGEMKTRTRQDVARRWVLIGSIVVPALLAGVTILAGHDPVKAVFGALLIFWLGMLAREVT